MDNMLCHGQEFVSTVRGLDFNENEINNELMDANKSLFSQGEVP